MKKNMFPIQHARLGLFLVIAFAILQINGFAQNKKFNSSGAHQPPVLEFQEDGYVPVLRSSMSTSPAYSYLGPGFSITQVNVNADGENMVGDAANEPSIAVDPTDPQKMAIGWRHFATINNSFRQAGNAFTTDGGETWTFPEVINPGIFRSDPVLGSDSDGNFYYNSLTVDGNDYYCDVYKSADGGETWDDGTFAYGGDKQWMSVDQSDSVGNGNLYAYWNASYSICNPDFFTRSSDNGVSFGACSSIQDYPYWGTTTVDAEGNLYIGAAKWNGFAVSRSVNAQNGNEDVVWDINATVDLDGSLVGFGGPDCPNPNGLLGQTIIDVDRSEGPNHGNVYLLASVERFSNGDPCDVMFSKSTDGGETWSPSVRVNDDPGNSAYQWFGTMSVAPTGRIDVVWLDTRDNPGSVVSALYYSYSLDGGDTWSENTKLSESFDPHVGWPQQNKMGDYFDMVSDETGANLAWSATFNGEQDVYYSYITFETVGINQEQNKSGISLTKNYPNPFSSKTSIRYYLDHSYSVSLVVTDITGRRIATLVDKNQSEGFHTVNFDGSRLEAGIYYYQLHAGTFSETKKISLVK